MKPSVLLTRLAVLSVSGLSVAASPTLELEKFDRLTTPVIDPASDDAQLALKRFTVPKDLKVSLWAAEPMLANPVAFDFDEKGRLFVSETHRYRTSVLDIRSYMDMLEDDMALRSIEERTALHQRVFGEEQTKQLRQESEIVRLVEDTDSDGVADKSSVFADGFNSELDGIASGVLARHGEVYFTNIPSLWKFTEQAGGAPKREELLRGFGVRYSFTGHDFHGLAIGTDGKLYYSIGDRGAHVKGKEGQVVELPDEGGVFRSNLDGTEFELVARGLRNPQELVFDEHGNLFTGDNDSDQGDMERLVYVVEGGDSGWRVGYQHAPEGHGGPWVKEGLWKPAFDGRPAYLLPPVCNIEDGPSGLTYYPGTGLTPAYKGHFFLTHFKGSIARSGIQTYTIKENGASFVPTSSQPFMGGVLPTDVTFGPDGVLYLLDWVDGWPKSQKGRVYGVRPANPDPAQTKISAELKAILAAGFEDRKDAELATLLAHPDRRARLEAQLELASRGPKSVGVFTKIANNSKADPLSRLHAVWGLSQLGRARSNVGPVLTKLLGDKDAEVRAQSAKGLGDIGYAKSSPALVRSLADPAARVQFFAAQSLGKLASESSTAPLLALLKRNANQDAYVRHAATYALSKIGRNAALDAAAKDADDAVRLGVVLVYRRLQDPALAQFLDDRNAFVAREAAEAINDANVEKAFGALAARLATAPVKDEAVVSRAINANFRAGGAERAQALAAYAANGSATPAMRAEALTQLGLWGDVPARDRVVGIFRPLPKRDGKPAADALAAALPKLLGSAPEPVQLAAIESIGKLDVRSSSDALVKIVSDEKAPVAVREAALGRLDGFGGDAVLTAVAAAEKSSVASLRLAGLQILARRAPDRALPVIKRFTASADTAEQAAAYRALGDLDSKQAPTLLVAAVDQLSAGKVLPGAQMELMDALDKSQSPAVKARWQKQTTAWSAGTNALAPYSFALAGGDPRAGGNEFWENAVLPCARCHKAFGEGGEAGPDLSLIGAKHKADYLLEAIVKPNAHIAPGFDVVTLALQHGSTETGSVAKESPGAIELKRADGSVITIDPKQVKTRTAAPSSMPEVYGQILTRKQLRDLVAFLTVLDGSRGNDEPEEAMGVSNRAMQAVAKESKGGGHQ